MRIKKRYNLLLAGVLFLFSACQKDEDSQSINQLDIFNMVWEEFDKTYPYFIHKSIDWDTIYHKYSLRVNDNTSKQELFETIGEMTLELRDIHVYLVSSMGSYHYSKKGNYPENPPVNAINYLDDISLDDSKCIFGRVSNTNYAYMRIKSFIGSDSDFHNAIASLDSLDNRDGFIIDIRHNNGGNEMNGQLIAGRFITGNPVYKYTRIRNGDDWEDFSAWHASNLTSNGSLGNNKKIILLTNRQVYSSAELFTLMMKTYDGLIIVGDTTGGASANPVKKTLPNNWTYFVSTWQAASPDFDLIEDNGIAPDHCIIMDESSISEGKDVILEKAVQLLDSFGRRVAG